MAIDKTYKDGGSGKGQAVRVGLDLTVYGNNLDRTKGTRQASCLDCAGFVGVNSVEMVNCVTVKGKIGLIPCDMFAKKV